MSNHKNILTVPHRRGQHQFDLLTTAQAAYLAVCAKFLHESEVVEVLLYLRRRAQAKVEAGLLASDLLVSLTQKVLEPHGEELVLADVNVILLAYVLLLDLVF